MENEPQFIDGLRVFKPHEKAPDFIVADMLFDTEELSKWLGTQELKEIKVQIKKSKAGKYYAQVNTWKPEKKEESQGASDDFEVPF